jgi:hypothetical protein
MRYIEVETPDEKIASVPSPGDLLVIYEKMQTTVTRIETVIIARESIIELTFRVANGETKRVLFDNVNHHIDGYLVWRV